MNKKNFHPAKSSLVILVVELVCSICEQKVCYCWFGSENCRLLNFFSFPFYFTVKLVHIFKGFNGGVTSLQCHETLPYVVSSSIDRFVRVHELETKKMLYKVYCKSRINHVILNKNGCSFSSALHADKNSPTADEMVDESSDTYDSESESTGSGDSDVMPFNNQTDYVSHSSKQD
ncbi:WD repeat-containing protein 74 [Trichinella zimbabwensis]|uniref:WD repeat-containing protein 74 n=1 Tax=Trichinella zimbabwensis TaxID=268475 RepID=A0A0V1HBD5_9BILA|nr:WD repeat-containing protein 74 [Trichinella zimbabwensis]